MKKALIITAIIVVVLVAAYFIRRATTKQFKVVKPLQFYKDEELTEPTDENPTPVGTINNKVGGGHISYKGNTGVISYNQGAIVKSVYFDKSCVKPVIF